jgi:hypothetical protein
MSETLGKMDKPEVAQFKNGRKLFFVPLIFTPVEREAALSELTAKYWDEVESHLANLESKLSDIKKIYHELLSGNEGIETLEDMSIGSYKIAMDMISKGAVLTDIEDKGVLEEYMEWGRCLSLDLRSPVVFAKVFEAYQEAQRKRNEHIARRIDETLQTDESAVLFMREGHHVQFPTDIQVFYVAPPSLDTIQRALRERQEKTYRKEARRAHDEEKQKEDIPQTENNNPEEGKT